LILGLVEAGLVDAKSQVGAKGLSEDTGSASEAESDMVWVVAQEGVFVEVQQPRDAAPALGAKGARFVGFEASPDDEGIP
jgi:hypothetical protein